MKTIYLASASKQRQHLMKQLGLNFIVKPAAVKEEDRITQGVSHLVKHNALLKARHVAFMLDPSLKNKVKKTSHQYRVKADSTSGIKQSIVIGCDTVVYSARGNLILKPKHMAHAKSQLKELMAKPHWVYSGLAVIDLESRREWTVVEKTKVFMRPLSDKQIIAYYRRMNPLDKAGGFDIEGLGAAFIYRIEGCFYNVVGLPLASMTRLLKECGVDVI